MASTSKAAEPSVILACHEYVVSMATRRVERLVLADEVEVAPAKAAGQGNVQVVRVGKSRYAAWNLGRMFELNPLKGSWVLLKIPHAGAELPMALAVGRCLLVSPVKDVTPLPPGVFRARRSALWGAFPCASIQGKLGGALMGLCLDPLRLWTREELEKSAAALIAAHAQ